MYINMVKLNNYHKHLLDTTTDKLRGYFKKNGINLGRKKRDTRKKHSKSRKKSRFTRNKQSGGNIPKRLLTMISLSFCSACFLIFLGMPLPVDKVVPKILEGVNVKMDAAVVRITIENIAARLLTRSGRHNLGQVGALWGLFSQGEAEALNCNSGRGLFYGEQSPGFMEECGVLNRFIGTLVVCIISYSLFFAVLGTANWLAGDPNAMTPERKVIQKEIDKKKAEEEAKSREKERRKRYAQKRDEEHRERKRRGEDSDWNLAALAKRQHEEEDMSDEETGETKQQKQREESSSEEEEEEEEDEGEEDVSEVSDAANLPIVPSFDQGSYEMKFTFTPEDIKRAEALINHNFSKAQLDRIREQAVAALLFQEVARMLEQSDIRQDADGKYIISSTTVQVPRPILPPILVTGDETQPSDSRITDVPSSSSPPTPLLQLTNRQEEGQGGRKKKKQTRRKKRSSSSKKSRKKR